MDKLRPFQLVVLAIFAFSAVLGLIIFANYGGFGGSKEQIGVVTIWGTLPQEAVAERISVLAGDNEAYTEVSYVQRSESTFSSDLSNAIAAGAGPDLVIISQETLLTEQNKLQLISFSSIPQRTYLDTYLPLFELFLTAEGTYGVPFVLDPLVLYYNRSQLASANLVSPPGTWESLAGIVPILTARDATGAVGRSAIALGDYANIQNARAIISLLLLQAGTPITQHTTQGIRSVLQGEESFGSTPAESAINFYTQFADPAKNVYSWNRSLANSRQQFLSGDLAFYVGFASELPYLQTANPNLSFDMAPIPQPATSVNRTTYGVGYMFALPKQSINPAGAFSVATALSDSDSMNAVAKSLSMAPARRALLTVAAEDTFTPIYYAAALTARGWLSPTPSVTDGIFAGMIGNITSGRFDVTQAINAAEQSLNASLR